MSENVDRLTRDQQDAVLNFAIKYKCVIDPEGWSRYLDRHGHCPCDKERLECPCKQAPQEIKQKARCLCGLFWSSYEAYSIAKSLRGAAVGIRVQPDEEEVEKQPNETEEPKTRHEKIEALFDFGERDKTTPPTLQRFVESAASILSIGTGIVLDPGQRMIISRNDDGSLSLDVSFNLTELGGKDIRG